MPATICWDFRENYPSIKLSFVRRCCVRLGVLGWANKQMKICIFPQLLPFSCLHLFTQANLHLPCLAPCCRLSLLSAISLPSSPSSAATEDSEVSLHPTPLPWTSLHTNETPAIVSQLLPHAVPASSSFSCHSPSGCRRYPSKM